jgi:hypothetical protein
MNIHLQFFNEIPRGTIYTVRLGMTSASSPVSAIYTVHLGITLYF